MAAIVQLKPKNKAVGAVEKKKKYSKKDNPELINLPLLLSLIINLTWKLLLVIVNWLGVVGSFILQLIWIVIRMSQTSLRLRVNLSRSLLRPPTLPCVLPCCTQQQQPYLANAKWGGFQSRLAIWQNWNQRLEKSDTLDVLDMPAEDESDSEIFDRPDKSDTNSDVLDKPITTAKDEDKEEDEVDKELEKNKEMQIDENSEENMQRLLDLTALHNYLLIHQWHPNIDVHTARLASVVGKKIEGKPDMNILNSIMGLL